MLKAVDSGWRFFPASARLSIVLVPFVVGGLALLIVGFSSGSTIHDATHDLRHTLGFPCH